MRKLTILALTAALGGCMNPNDPDAYTHCLIRYTCLDIPANRGNGPGFWGVYNSGALAATVLNMNREIGANTQSTLSELQHNLAVIGASHRPTVCNVLGNQVICN